MPFRRCRRQATSPGDALPAQWRHMTKSVSIPKDAGAFRFHAARIGVEAIVGILISGGC